MSIVRFDISAITDYLEGENLVLLPNHRTMDMVLETWAQHKSKERIQAWPRPRVYAIDVWIQESWERTAFLREFAREDDSSTGLRYGWSEASPRILNSKEELLLWRQVLDDSDIAPGLINRADTAKDLNRAHQLANQWRLDEGSFEAYLGIPDVAAFRLWRQTFIARCKKQAIISLSDATALFVAEIEQLSDSLEEKPIVLYNFDSPPPLYRALFAALSANCGVQKLSSNPSPSAQLESTAASMPEGSRTQKYPDETSEIRAVASWAVELQRQNPDAHIGVVCPSAGSLAARFGQEFRLSLGVTDNPAISRPVFNLLAAGEPLLGAPLIALALDYLSLNLELVDSQQLLAFLASPLLRYEGWETELDAKLELLRQLNRQLEPVCQLAFVRSLMLMQDRSYYCPQLAALLLQIDESRRLKLRGDSPSQRADEFAQPRKGKKRMLAQHWAELFQRQTGFLHWPLNRGLDFDDGQLNRLLKEWDTALRQLAQAGSLLPELGAAAAINQLKMILREDNQPNPFDPQLNVSLLTAEQALMYRFDHLRVIQLTARNWPGSASATAFIPYALQREHAMPSASAEERLAECRQQLTELSRCTEHPLLYSFHERDSDGNALRASALINFSGAEAVVSPARQTASHAEAIEYVLDPAEIPLGADEVVQGGSNLINNQSQCPFRAFARHRLNAARLESIEAGLSAADRGSALHLSLKHIWGELGNSAALRNASGNFDLPDGLLERAVGLAIKFLKSRYPLSMSPRYTELEQQRIRELLIAALQVDFMRPEFQVIETEQRYEWHSDKLQLRLQIDRIDRLVDGSLAVIDYKTGKRTLYQWLEERPDDLQLPLYQLVVSAGRDEDVSAALICQINPENFAYLGISGSDALTAGASRSSALKSIKLMQAEWPQIKSLWRSTIDSLADEFVRGHAPVQPVSRSQSCRYCDLAGLCRIAELDSGDNAEAGREATACEVQR